MIGICFATALTATIGAAEEARELRAHRLGEGETIVLDGHLGEDIWSRVDPADGFRQQEPREGEAATEATEVRIVYDSEQLYIGALLHDSNPDGVIGFQKQRDTSLRSDDRFMFTLDTFRDGRTAFFFEINPAGLMGDGLLRVGSGDSMNKAWDGVWEARVTRGDHGWSAEVRIPFRTLSFDPDRLVWGIDFQRTVRRKNEESLWSGYRLNQGLFLPIHAGRLTGLEDLSQGMGLEAIPYAAASYKEDGGETSTPADVGIDLSYNLTPNMRAAVTVNTDFAEVEVDDRQVNLTRFPLFFPEKRDFFLEDSSVYNFAGANGVRPYFSRRIGLVGGSPIPIVYGARLGGRIGAFDLGLLQVHTGRQGDVTPEDFTVLRAKRNLFAQSSLGVIYTRRGTSPTEGDEERERGADGPPARHTVGVDLDLFSSQFLGDKNLQFEAFWVAVSDPLAGESSATFLDRSARGLRLSYPNDRWQAHVSFRELGDLYDPSVGFVPRNGFRRVQPSLSFEPRIDSALIRQLEFEVFFEHLASLDDNALLTRTLRLTPLGIRFESGDELGFQWSETFELLDEPFEIADGVVLPVGEYVFRELSVEAESAEHRVVSGEVRVGRGSFWSGDQTGLEASFTVRPFPGFDVGAEWESNWIELPEGAFTTELVQISNNWAVSPWSSVTSIVQYDNVSAVLGVYARLRWIVRPGSDLYLVYSHNWLEETGRFRTLDRGVTTKLNYTYRF